MIDTMGDARAAETPASDIAAAERMQRASSERQPGHARKPGLRASGHSRELRELRRVYRPNDIRRRTWSDFRYGEAAILAEIRRVGRLVKEPVYSYARFHRHSRLSRKAITRCFGLWRTALERAGLGDRYGGPPITRKMLRKPPRLSDEAIFGALRAIATAHGGGVVTPKQVDASAVLTIGVVYRRFGSLNAALALAGLATSPRGRRYTEEQCLDNIARLWRHYGRAPHQRDLLRPPSTVGTTPYVRRYGTWNRALAVYAVRREPGVGDPAALQQIREEGRRTAGARLRLRVLQRDRFRCVLCGDNPAADPGCVLQVDHLLPFSKGGRTEASNLRTLCRTCNLGRGNRVEA